MPPLKKNSNAVRPLKIKFLVCAQNSSPTQMESWTWLLYLPTQTAREDFFFLQEAQFCFVFCLELSHAHFVIVHAFEALCLSLQPKLSFSLTNTMVGRTFFMAHLNE